MELKVVCQCGQKFKFDVEPVNGQMPFAVNCPVCNLDGTVTANAMLAQMLTAPPPVAPAPGGLRINRHADSAPDFVSPPPLAPAAGASAPQARMTGSTRPFAAAAAAQTPAKQPSFGMGLLGGFIGTFVGVVIYFLIFKFTGMRFKLLAVGVGALAGWFAEFLGKGEGSKELGGITAVFVLAGVIGAQYFVALGWWHQFDEMELKAAQSAYTNSVAEAREVVKTIPTGSDAEVRAYLAKSSGEDGEKLKPSDISDGDIKFFRENQLPEYQGLASGQITKEEYEKKHELKTTQTQAEKDSEEKTVKTIFLLLLLSKANLFSLAAAAGLAFKLCTNA